MKRILWAALLYSLPVLTATSQPLKDKNDGGLHPLRSSAALGLGPLNIPYLVDAVLGSAFVYGGKQEDLFILGRKTGASSLFLCRWLRTDPSGAPVFAEPIKLPMPPSGKGSVLQTPDGIVHGFWIVRDSLLVHTVFDRKTMAFRKTAQYAFPGLPSAPLSVTAFANADGSFEMIVEVRGFRRKGKYPNQHPSTAEWRPYDEAGISSLPMQYNCLYGFHLPLQAGATLPAAERITQTTKEVYSSMQALAPVELEPGRKGLITGSRVGVFPYYEKLSDSSADLLKRKYMVDEQHIVIRHPSVNPTVCAYRTQGRSGNDIIAAGEGAVYYYRYTGRRSANGDPVFREPLTVLQENADLFLGTLPVPSVADWDGDGVADIIAGNSEGFVLFSKNIGTNERPQFLPGQRIHAGGKELHVQAGYTSIQGIPETRWGYTSPAVFDWNDDGLPDLVMGDITGDYRVYMNIGTKKEPRLDAGRQLYLDGIELHGMWRCTPALVRVGRRTAMLIVDEDDEFHLYWKRDDLNVEDGGKVLLSNGNKISASLDPGGGTGRCKLSFFDYDGDGKPDLIIGTGFRSAIPDKKNGFPQPSLGKNTIGTPLFMKNVGQNNRFLFEPPQPFMYEKHGLVQPGGIHEAGAVATSLGGGSRPSLLVADEAGRLFLLDGSRLRLMKPGEAERYQNNPNPFPGYPAGRE